MILNISCCLSCAVKNAEFCFSDFKIVFLYYKKFNISKNFISKKYKRKQSFTSKLKMCDVISVKTLKYLKLSTKCKKDFSILIFLQILSLKMKERDVKLFAPFSWTGRLSKVVFYSFIYKKLCL